MAWSEVAGMRLRRGLRRGLRGSAALVLLAIATLLAASWLVRREARPHLYTDVGVLPARDVALVLGASVHRDGRPSPVVEARLEAALALLHSGKVARVLVSGDHKPDQYDEAEAMRNWLLKAGVPARQIAVDRAGVRTFDSMVRAAGFFHVTSAVICTQAFHLPRAVFLARRAGIDAVGLQVGRGLIRADPRDLARESLATVRALIDVQALPPRP